MVLEVLIALAISIFTVVVCGAVGSYFQARAQGRDDERWAELGPQACPLCDAPYMEIGTNRIESSPSRDQRLYTCGICRASCNFMIDSEQGLTYHQWQEEAVRQCLECGDIFRGSKMTACPTCHQARSRPQSTD